MAAAEKEFGGSAPPNVDPLSPNVDPIPHDVDLYPPNVDTLSSNVDPVSHNVDPIPPNVDLVPTNVDPVPPNVDPLPPNVDLLPTNVDRRKEEQEDNSALRTIKPFSWSSLPTEAAVPVSSLLYPYVCIYPCLPPQIVCLRYVSLDFSRPFG